MPRERQIPVDPNHSAAHSLLVNAALRNLAELTWCGKRACWADKRIIGKFVATHEDGSKYTLTTGRTGQADIQGSTCSIDLAGPVAAAIPGLHFELEAKTGEGVLTPGQKNWAAVCQKLGVLHLVFHEPEEPGVFLLAKLDEIAAWYA